VLVPNNLTVTLPGAAVEDQNDVRASMTWWRMAWIWMGGPAWRKQYQFHNWWFTLVAFACKMTRLLYYVAPLHVPNRLPGAYHCSLSGLSYLSCLRRTAGDSLCVPLPSEELERLILQTKLT
jgi:hypothetical protein